MADLDIYIGHVIDHDTTVTDTLKTIRLYTEGDQPRQFTTAQLEMLGRTHDANFNPVVNVCPTIIEAEADQLNVLGFQITIPAQRGQSEPNEGGDEAPLGDTLEHLTAETWRLSRMELAQQAVAYGGIRDGDAYLVVEYDPGDDTVRYFYNSAFDGHEGVHAVYREPTNPDSMLYAFKMWETTQPGAGLARRVQRLNVYWPDRIEYYITDGRTGAWRPHEIEETDSQQGTQLVELESAFTPGQMYTASVAWHTDDGTPDGTPLGIPVIHYPHRSYGNATGVSGLREIIPGVQDSINIAQADTMMASTLTGTPIYFLSGYEPPAGLSTSEDGHVKVELIPGQILYTRNENAGAIRLEGTLIPQLTQHRNEQIKTAAMLTSTPLTFFNQTGQIPAEGTLNSLQDRLVAKVEKTQVGLGTLYSEAARMALRYYSAYSERLTIDLETIDRLDIDVKWDAPSVKSTQDILNELQLKANLGVPEAQLWTEMGYSDEQQQDFEDARRQDRSTTIGQILQGLQATETQTAPTAAGGGQPPVSEQALEALGVSDNGGGA